MQKSIVATIVEETITFSLNEICEHYNISQELLVQMMEYGVIDFSSQLNNNYHLELKTLKRVKIAERENSRIHAYILF